MVSIKTIASKIISAVRSIGPTIQGSGSVVVGGKTFTRTGPTITTTGTTSSGTGGIKVISGGGGGTTSRTSSGSTQTQQIIKPSIQPVPINPKTKRPFAFVQRARRRRAGIISELTGIPKIVLLLFWKRACL